MDVELIASDSAEIGTHALIIAVGAYPHVTEQALGVRPLYSPKPSAEIFRNWVKSEFYFTGKPLASLHYLASDPNDRDLVTFAVVSQAVRKWKERCSANENNLALFYFVGHGVSAGDAEALLLDDLGNPATPDDFDAFDFPGLVAGMRNCKARTQIYIVDACRSSVAQIARSPLDLKCNPILAGRVSNGLSNITPTVIRSTQANAVAQGGKKGEASLFTSAFVKAMSGAAASQVVGKNRWFVDTLSLPRGIDYYMSDKSSSGQLVDIKSTRTPLHHFSDAKPPLVPVTFNCDPEADFHRCKKVGYRRFDQTNFEYVNLEGTTTTVNLPVKVFEFSAIDAAEQRFGTATNEPRPPFITVILSRVQVSDG